MIGVILAGGQSRRMGEDKAQLQWRGLRLLEHMSNLLRTAGAIEVVVSGARPGGVCDRRDHLGPIGGVATVASLHPGARLLFVAIDTPRLSPALLARLYQCPARCTHFDGWPLPFCLIATPQALSHLDAICAQSEARARSLREMHRRLGALALDLTFAEEEQLRGANTPEQWADLQSTLHHVLAFKPPGTSK